VPLLLLRRTWLRRVLAAILGLALGLALVGGLGWRNARSRAALADDLRRAFAAQDARAIEALFCWDGVDAATRARLRLVIQQEHELPIASIVVRPLGPFDRQPGAGLRPNLEPDAVLEVTFATTDRLSAAYLIGRDGWAGHRLVVMLPSAK
jgi:hypothetical protein